MAKRYKGVDISLYQGDVDFAALRDGGIDFVMIKASQGRTAEYNAPFADPKFRQNAGRFASTPGKIYAGAYHYLMARDGAEAKREADYFIQTVAPYRAAFSLWMALDVEDASLPGDYGTLTRIVEVFCDAVREAGYRPMVYSSTWWLDHRFAVPGGVPVWEANWSRTEMPSRARMWQSGIAKNLPGIVGEVDVNEAVGIMGDGDGDGAVTLRDAALVLRVVAGWKNTGADVGQLDFDRDGRVSLRDAATLMRVLS